MRPALSLVLLLNLALAQTPMGQLSTRDAHALLWLPDGQILLGHHDGIQVSADGGKSWQNLIARPNWDAMNLAWDGKRLIVAGHDVYAESTNLKTFRNLQPQGLSGLDLHGYAVDPKHPRLHYAYEASGGLYRSQDGGQTWSKLPQGTPIMTVGLDGTLYLAAPGLGLLQERGQSLQPIPGPEPDLFVLGVASDGSLYIGGKQGLWVRIPSGWKKLAPGPILTLAINPKNPTQLVWIDGTGRIWRK